MLPFFLDGGAEEVSQRAVAIDFLRSDTSAPASGFFLRFRSRDDQQRLVQVAPRRV